MLDVVDDTITGCLGTNEGTTPVETLASEHSSELVLELLVSTEEVTDLTSTGTNVTSGNIGVLPNVSEELAHEGDAEATDFAVRLALGVKVRASLSTSHVQAGEGVLEGLLETQEFEDREVDGGVKSETTLVGTQGRVVLQNEI